MTDSSQDEAARAGSPGTAGSNGGQSIADAANDYFKRGWKPVPISLKTKRPVGMEWQKRPFSPEQFNGKARNVGIQFSPVSGNLVDVDLDSKLVIDLASYFLPDTNAIFGRQSKPASHRFYIADFSGEGKKAAIQFKDGDAMIVELRIGAGGKGAQSVVPPSVHSSGELIQWINDNPTPVDALELKRAVTKLAAACLLVPRYPDLGSRHDAALVLGGVLARANWTANETEHFVRVVAKSADCESWAEHATAAKSAVEAMANGTHISGRKRLVEVWGEDLADTFMKWGIGNKDSEFKTPLSHLPELLIDSGDLTETATQIAGMFAQHRRFLFNGYEPIRVVRENEEMPEAVPITPEAVRVFTHELRTSLKFVRGGR